MPHQKFKVQGIVTALSFINSPDTPQSRNASMYLMYIFPYS